MTRPYGETFIEAVRGALDELDLDAVAAVVGVLERAQSEERTVWAVGNGGSAAIASHFAADLAAASGAGGLRVVCLSDNVPRLTALANDVGFEAVFQQPIRQSMCAGDVLVMFTASGDSENVLRAARAAQEVGGTVVGVLGFGGGRARALSDHAITVTSRDYAVVESVSGAVEHLLATWLRRRLHEGA